MKLNKALLISLCACSIFINTHVSAASKQKQINQHSLQQAYNRLVKKAPARRNVRKQTKKTSRYTPPARYQAILAAKRQIRKKYRWGGSSPRTGFDCSGLTQYAYKSAKVHLPRTAREQFKHTKRISLSKLQVGDLIFFRTRRTRARVNHVGIYLGGGKFIHAPRKGKRVSVANLNKYWRRKAVGAGRV